MTSLYLGTELGLEQRNSKYPCFYERTFLHIHYENSVLRRFTYNVISDFVRQLEFISTVRTVYAMHSLYETLIKTLLFLFDLFHLNI